MYLGYKRSTTRYFSVVCTEDGHIYPVSTPLSCPIEQEKPDDSGPNMDLERGSTLAISYIY